MTDQLTPAATARLLGLRDWYAMVDPSVKTFFEAFYQRDKALTAAVLTYDEVPGDALVGETLEAALAAAAVGGLPRPDIVANQYEGLRLADGEKGTLRWTVRMADGDLGSWEDQIIVYGADGSVIHDEKVTREGLAKGAEREDTYELPALPVGVCTATVWVNVGGADQGQPAGPQGYRIGFPVTLAVGETAETQRLQEMPQWGTFVAALSSAAQTPWGDDGDAQRHLIDAVNAAKAFERLGQGFQDELRRVEGTINGAVPTPENWPAVQQRLTGIASGSPDEIGNAVLALVEVIDELSAY
jgi:hypothetical protein